MPAADIPIPCWPRDWAELVEFRPIQELAEDAGDLTFDDAGPVILHGDERLSGALPHFDSDLGQYSSFLARIERVVDGLLDGRDQRLGRRSKPSR